MSDKIDWSKPIEFVGPAARIGIQVSEETSNVVAIFGTTGTLFVDDFGRSVNPDYTFRIRNVAEPKPEPKDYSKATTPKGRKVEFGNYVGQGAGCWARSGDHEFFVDHLTVEFGPHSLGTVPNTWPWPDGTLEKIDALIDEAEAKRAHEPIEGVTLWNSTSEIAGRLGAGAGISVDGAFAGYIGVYGVHDPNNTGAYYVPRRVRNPAHTDELLTKIRDEVRAKRKEAEKPKATPLSFETWPKPPVMVRNIGGGSLCTPVVVSIGGVRFDGVVDGVRFDLLASHFVFTTDHGEYPCTVEGLAAMRAAGVVR